ncbi:hypothetical protein SLOPH_698 [Spraguea lophii 42_110]|uniref:Uncharacterized protein n=1 Tax=Spraguea lophii (strain 42_110) TaxID=1358809 RepID=S7W7T1_SPRLO|nr:hypothetical protein SLOPH_698 [Spraguea lophii 42_110]
MVNFLNLFLIFKVLNYNIFLHNIKATNNNFLKKKTKHVITLENIKEEKYEINGKISLFPSYYPICEEKYVKITEIEYDGIEIHFVDKDHLPIDIKEPEFHRIMHENLKSNSRDYYFRIISIIFKITIFIEEKCFHTTLLWNYFSKPIKIYSSLYDQLLESIRLLEPNFGYHIILPLNYFNNTTFSNSECSENKNIYDVNVLKFGKVRNLLSDLTINKDSKTYNINYFRFDRIYSELYTKIYYKTTDYRMIEGYIGKSINQCNINENILVFYTKTNKQQDENNNNIIQNETGPANISKTTITSYSTQKKEVENQDLDLISKCKHCQKNVESKETQINLDDVNIKDREK